MNVLAPSFPASGPMDWTAMGTIASVLGLLPLLYLIHQTIEPKEPSILAVLRTNPFSTMLDLGVACFPLVWFVVWGFTLDYRKRTGFAQVGIALVLLWLVKALLFSSQQ